MTKWKTTDTTSRENTVYHTDKDCPVIGDNIRELHESEVEFHELRECKYCTGDGWRDSDGGNTDLHDKLLDASPDEVGKP